MASIFKRGRDQAKRNAAYYIEYIDYQGKRRRKKGFTDKGLTEQLAAKLENEVMLRREGLINAEDEAAAQRKSAPIEEHLVAFETSISRGDNTQKHVKLTMSRVRRIVQETGVEKPADIDFESVEQVIREMVDSEKIGHKTYNHYLQAMDQFCNWLCQGQRRILSHNPIAGMERLNTEIDVRHPRRALKPDEFVKLVESARSSGVEIQCFDGEDRARIYLISYFTGLRRKEIGSLRPRSFDLDGDPPTVTVQAACSKHRRKDVLPLHEELVSLLRLWLNGKSADEVLFTKLGQRRTWSMVRQDLERVGIPYETTEGIADFHAAGRHTHITELLRNGASLPEAKELARHCDVRMTMKYTHVGIDDRAKALRSLPSPIRNSSQHSGQQLVGPECPQASSAGSDQTPASSSMDEKTPEDDTDCHAMASVGAGSSNSENGFDSRRSRGIGAPPIYRRRKRTIRQRPTCQTLCQSVTAFVFIMTAFMSKTTR